MGTISKILQGAVFVGGTLVSGTDEGKITTPSDEPLPISDDANGVAQEEEQRRLDKEAEDLAEGQRRDALRSQEEADAVTRKNNEEAEAARQKTQDEANEAAAKQQEETNAAAQKQRDEQAEADAKQQQEAAGMQ